jgi:hypothetical protein
MADTLAPRDKAGVAAIFNTQLVGLLQDLARVIPGHPDLIQSRSAIALLVRASPLVVIRIWTEYVYNKYAAMIDAGDIAFFVSKDYSADLSGNGNANHVLGIIDRLRDPVRNMEPANYPRVMKYVQNLSKLAAIYDSVS